jgi:hypothetical protein
MKNKYSVMVAFILIAVMLSQGALAINGFREYSVVYDNLNITRNYARISYTEENYLTPAILYVIGIPYYHEIDNFVPKGKPYEAYITYGLQPLDDWNSQHPYNTIDYCRIIVKEWHLVNTATGGEDWSVVTSLNKTFTAGDTAVTTGSYRQFLILNKGEYARVYFDCHFTGANLTIEIPTSITITAPTYECKACQYYDEYKQSFDDVIGDAIETYTQTILKNTNLFIGWNFDIIITFFWLLQIVIFVSIVGIIFLGLWWVWRFLKRMADSWN